MATMHMSTSWVLQLSNRELALIASALDGALTPDNKADAEKLVAYFREQVPLIVDKGNEREAELKQALGITDG